jgi:GTP-binding protein SAR1
MRKIWKNYMTNINGIVYMVDSSDRARVQLSKKVIFNKIYQKVNYDKI